MGHHGLQQGDGGGDGCQHHQQVEDDAEDRADHAAVAVHVVKHVLHGDEQQLGAADGAFGIEGEAGRHNAQAGHQSHQGIHDHDEHGVLLQVLLLAQVRTVGDHRAHADGQREEHLTSGGGDDLEDAGSFGDDAVGHGPAGNEHILQAVHSAGQGAGADDADQQHHEQGRHTDAAELLDAAADAAHNDEHGQRHEDQTVDDALALAGQERAEHIAAAEAV